MKYDLKVSAEFVNRCTAMEAEFAFDIAESYHDGKLHHDSNYRNVHTEVLLQFIDLFTKFKGLVPEPLFSNTINNLMETINTNCGWE